MNFHPLFLLLEIYSKPLCSFRTWTVSILSLHRQIRGLLNEKVLLRCGKKKAPSELVTFFFSLSLFPFCFWFCITYVFCFLVLSYSSLYFVLFNMFLFVYFQFCFILFFIIKIIFFKKSKKYKNNVCSVYIGTYVHWMAIKTKFSKLCIFYSLDGHLYA